MIHGTITELVKNGFGVSISYKPNTEEHLRYSATISNQLGILASSTGTDPVRAMDNLSHYLSDLSSKEFVKHAIAAQIEPKELIIAGEMLDEAYPNIRDSIEFKMFLAMANQIAVERATSHNSTS